MSFITDNRLETQKYLKLLAACSPLEQTILQVLAVIYYPVGQTNFKQILSLLAKTPAFMGQRLSPTFTPEVRDKLKKSGLVQISSRGIEIQIYLGDVLTRQCAEKGTLREIIDQIEAVIPVTPLYSWSGRDPEQIEREGRNCFYLRDFKRCRELIQFDKNPQAIDLNNTLCLARFCFYPFELDVFLSLPEDIRYQVFAALLLHLRINKVNNLEVVTLLQSLYEQGLCNDNMKLLLAEQYLLNGALDSVVGLLADTANTDTIDSAYRLALGGWLAFLQGDIETSLADFEQSRLAKNKIARRKHQYIGGLPGLFYLLALLKSAAETPENLLLIDREVDNYARDKRAGHYELSCHQVIASFARVLSGKNKDFRPDDFFYDYYRESFSFQLKLLLNALCVIWNRKKINSESLKLLEQHFKQASRLNCHWYTQVLAQILLKYDKSPQACNKYLSQHPAMTIDMLTLIKRKEAWLQALDLLIAMQNRGSPTARVEHSPMEKQTRMIWMLDTDHPYSIEPKEQKMGKKGWTKGRTVSLKRLHDDWQALDHLSEQDIRLCQAITADFSYGYGGWGREYYGLSGYSALHACVGHTQLYLADNPEQLVEIVEGEPELLVTESEDGFLVQMPGLPKDIGDYKSYFRLIEETANRYRLINYSDKQLEVAAIIGGNGIKVPKKAKHKILASIKAIAPLLNIQSDIAGLAEADTGIEQVLVDQTLYINIQSAGGGLQLECHVQPLGEQGPSLLPGSGNPTVMAEIDGKRLLTNRDLELEKLLLAQLVEACPLFEYMTGHCLLLDDLQDALSCLEQLELLQATGFSNEQAPKLVLQWPKGQPIKLSKPANEQQMQISFVQQRDWFTLQGELTFADDEVLELKKLLTLMEDSPGRFIRLKDNEFIALTEQLRRQLDTLATAGHQGKFHSLAAPLIEEAVAGMQLKSNRAWQQQCKRLRESFTITPQLPPTLQAKLRDYQKDGFDWACRLAHWGGGACLADDMGLGKTLQALALILSRSPAGPTLVLAPTSVCFNWQEEANRFAPTLNVVLYGTADQEQRNLMLNNAGPFDLIVCSYGLLQTQQEQLAKVEWHTIVADEAQALKNPQAKRSQIAMHLKADFKMITTGTPIENNLSELWSLFRFINPGLLGSLEQFRHRFVNPIETADKNDRQKKQANQALRKLISPFILRRLKSEVLTELPSRTEINLHIELSREELAFYEALRQNAVEKLSQSQDKAGQKRIKILAEIMRLRRACCHPSLVVEETDIAGSKLKAFDELIEELKLGNHKALVFSQFVGHLAILRQHLTAKGINFQYLDGSTSPANRQKAVSAFQAGQGDLFLISLKAGGSGLNLTAADYVIHMDPWWNPAVEDQASDRAHRMGQTRPVTIYRLIAKNTIEDKIVALHQQKRELANSLLEGTESSAQLSLEDMMSLLRQE